MLVGRAARNFTHDAARTQVPVVQAVAVQEGAPAVERDSTNDDIFDKFMYGYEPYPEYAPGNLTPQDMREVHRSAVRQFYFRPEYIRQALGRVRRPSDLVQYGRAAKSLFKMTDINRPIWALGRNRANA